MSIQIFDSTRMEQNSSTRKDWRLNVMFVQRKRKWPLNLWSGERASEISICAFQANDAYRRRSSKSKRRKRIAKLRDNSARCCSLLLKDVWQRVDRAVRNNSQWKRHGTDRTTTASSCHENRTGVESACRYYCTCSNDDSFTPFGEPYAH